MVGPPSGNYHTIIQNRAKPRETSLQPSFNQTKRLGELLRARVLMVVFIPHPLKRGAAERGLVGQLLLLLLLLLIVSFSGETHRKK